MINDDGYISRRDAIKLAEEEEAYGHISVYDLSKLPAVDFAANWTLCSEELPKKYGNYLVTMDDDDVQECTYEPNEDGLFIRNGWTTCDSHGIVFLANAEVIAWMPLPKPCVRNC